MRIVQRWLITDNAETASVEATLQKCVGWYVGVPPALREAAQVGKWVLPCVWTEEFDSADLDCTEAIVAVIVGNTSVAHIDLQVGYVVDAARLPDGVTCAPWAEDWSEGLDADGHLVVRFRA